MRLDVKSRCPSVHILTLKSATQAFLWPFGSMLETQEGVSRRIYPFRYVAYAGEWSKVGYPGYQVIGSRSDTPEVYNDRHGASSTCAEEKRKYSKENSPTNNARFGSSFVLHAERALEWKDFLSMDEMLEYTKSSEVLIKLKGLNVKRIDEIRALMLLGSRRVNLNYYPMCPNPEHTVGVGRHSDISTFTILLQDDIGGLHVRKDNGNGWIHVSLISRSFIINIWDALQIISKGRHKSIEYC
ncbi:hypothetical protein CUMW_180000, partial [Citrus unshiu]